MLCLCSFAATHAHAQQAERVEWQPQWLKVQPVEYVATGALAVRTLAIALFVDPQDSGGSGGFLYDNAIRDALRLHTRSGRDTARVVGDLGYRTMLIFPFVDAGLNWVIHQNSEVAWQMFAMDAEIPSFAGFVGFVTDHFIGRARPSVPNCHQDPSYERFCNESDQYSSFVSGHSVIAAAGAGVTCAHHLSLPLYGGGAGDIAACAAASAVALTTGIARIANDRHWATDVTVAWLVGGFAGYGWLKWFHYRPVSADAKNSLHLTVLPMFAPGYISGTAVGMF
jgi:membrane-associated phospholipid phosphatase